MHPLPLTPKPSFVSNHNHQRLKSCNTITNRQSSQPRFTFSHIHSSIQLWRMHFVKNVMMSNILVWGKCCKSGVYDNHQVTLPVVADNICLNKYDEVVVDDEEIVVEDDEDELLPNGATEAEYSVSQNGLLKCTIMNWQKGECIGRGHLELFMKPILIGELGC